MTGNVIWEGFKSFLSDIVRFLLVMLVVAIVAGMGRQWPELDNFGKNTKGEREFELIVQQTPSLVWEALKESGDYVVTYPRRTAEIAAVAAVIFAVLGLALSRRRRFSEPMRRWVMSPVHSWRAGLINSFTHAKHPRKGWHYIDEHCQQGRSQTMRIVGATGWQTFGHEKSPLHETLKNFRGKIEVALLHPDSPFLPMRADTVNTPVEDYKREIRQTLDFLDQLKRKNENIDIRQYNARPNWKIIMVDEYCWMQYYQPMRHVAESAAWLFRNKRDGLYQVFAWECERIWSRCVPAGAALPPLLPPPAPLGSDRPGS